MAPKKIYRDKHMDILRQLGVPEIRRTEAICGNLNASYAGSIL